ncbi:MAG: DUF4869 domain-containing protein [Collinsella sp.]
MLSVYFGDMPEAIYNTATYFKNSYRSSWITDPYAVSIIKMSIDRLLSPKTSSKALCFGIHLPTPMLSGGVKTLPLARFHRKHTLTLSTRGDNCAKMSRHGERPQAAVNLYHVMDSWSRGFQNQSFVNSGRIVHKHGRIDSRVDSPSAGAAYERFASR